MTLTAIRRGAIENGETTSRGRIEYDYSADGALASAEEFVDDGTDPFRTFRYVTDGGGNVTEITEIGFSGDQTSRLVLAYDEFSNITRTERFDGDGSLRIVNTYRYTPSGEPVVNMISLLSALTGTYVPSPDPVEYF